MLALFDQVAMEVVLLHYPDYERIHSEIHVRSFDLPVHYTLRQLRQSHLNCLVRVSGVVTRFSKHLSDIQYHETEEEPLAFSNQGTRVFVG